MDCDTEGLEIYLKPTEAIDSDHETVRRVAMELTSPFQDDPAKARVLFYFVRDQVHYSVYMISTKFEDFIASTVLARGKGYCVQKAVLLAALARAVGIPSRLVFAMIRNHKVPQELIAQTGINVFPSHGYTQFFLREKWVSVTPAFDKKLCEKSGVPAVEFDEVHDAPLPEKDLSGNPYVDYIEKYEPQADLPFEWLRGKVVPIWGEKSAWLTLEESKGHRMPSGYVFPEIDTGINLP
jgi:transglutaminase-like putative cysteine protease